MELSTESGIITGDKKSHYMKWLEGFISTNAWTGTATVDVMWKRAVKSKKEFKNISWYDLGVFSGLMWFEECGLNVENKVLYKNNKWL